jgi:hypothetical protein
MKKYLVFLLLSIATVSCYDDYIFDFTYSGIYFPYQVDVRTFVVGEGMKIEVGTTLGGVHKNTFDRNVNYILDNTLITPSMLYRMQYLSAQYIKDATLPVATLQQLPSNFYTISNSTKMVIATGQHMGSVVIKPDSTQFLNDSVNTINATYALPFYITTADADSVVNAKRWNVVGVKFENMLFGMYWHGGQAIVTRPTLADTTITYKTTVPVPEAKIWVLKTVGPSTLTANGFFDQVTANKAQMKLTLKGSTVEISSAAGSTFTVLPDGASTFNRSKLLQERKIFLKYTYLNTVNGYTYHCTDTLTFRNRIRDGISEWQDENPAHYTK